jgi:poly(3-hydroxybutyrate) depolymerase
MKSLHTSVLLALGFLTAATTLVAQQVLQFNPASYTIGENAGDLTLTVQRTGDTNADVSVDYATADGTATAGVKYTATNGTLAFTAGETRRLISVQLLNDNLPGSTTAFQVRLSNPTGGAALGTPTNASVSILDPDKGVSFRFASYTTNVTEDIGEAVIGIARGDLGDQPMSVDLNTSDLTAHEGVDYTGLHTNVVLPADKRPYFFNIPILNNQTKDGNRTFRITMSNPVNGMLGCTPITTVTIVDNDPGFEFEAASYSVAEDGGSVLIGVRRGNDDTSPPVSVNYATSDVSALAGTDYVSTNGTLAFAAGETVKTIVIPILNDGLKESTKSFRVALSDPAGGAVLGSRATTTASIQDNDPGLGFEKASYSVWAGSGEITLTVIRGSDESLEPFTVDYATVDGSGKAGQDYEARAGTLEFGANETLKRITVPILRNIISFPTRTFTVTLSNPSNGLVFGTASAGVVIQRNYCTVTPRFDCGLVIQSEVGAHTLRWSGGGSLQRADQVTGPWQTLASASSPWRVGPRDTTSFYRVSHPRPTTIYVPSSYDPARPMPLFFLIHGADDTGQGVEAYMQFRPLAESRGFLYCYPDGSTIYGHRLWNATDVAHDQSADWGASIADDAGYIRDLIGEIARCFAVDRKRIYIVGRSAGANLVWRMGAQFADLVAGISAQGNSGFWDPTLIVPSEPVHVLYLHSVDDNYWGGPLTLCDGLFANFIAWPSAERTIRDWANYNGASHPVTDPEPTMDLIYDVAGMDTVVTRYQDHPPGGAVELWTLRGPHHPNLTPNYSPAIVDWLLAHPKP